MPLDESFVEGCRVSFNAEPVEQVDQQVAVVRFAEF
jgi:hypothetical protein